MVEFLIGVFVGFTLGVVLLAVIAALRPTSPAKPRLPLRDEPPPFPSAVPPGKGRRTMWDS